MRKKRVLVVDDDEDVRALVRRLLESSGFEVETASEGSEAIPMIEAGRPDLVILDLMMPGLDGWGVLELLQERPDPPRVVLLTMRADFDSFSRAVRAGASAYVLKPFNFQELIATCQRVLAGPGAAGTRRRVPTPVVMGLVALAAVTASACTAGRPPVVVETGQEAELLACLASAEARCDAAIAGLEDEREEDARVSAAALEDVRARLRDSQEQKRRVQDDLRRRDERIAVLVRDLELTETEVIRTKAKELDSPAEASSAVAEARILLERADDTERQTVSRVRCSELLDAAERQLDQKNYGAASWLAIKVRTLLDGTHRSAAESPVPRPSRGGLRRPQRPPGSGPGA